MKNRKSLASLLIAGGLLGGFASYVIAQFSNSFYVQLIPLVAYPLIILAFFSKYLKLYITPDKGAKLIFISQLIMLGSVFFLLLFAPSGASRSMDISMISLIILALIGISLLITAVLKIFIYYKVHNENNLSQPLRQ